MSQLVPGLFGKLPARGDFVQRGWPVETVSALDNWLTEGLAVEHAANDDDGFAVRMNSAPLWQGYIPPGAAGPLALHIALAPSIDKVGRYFFLAGGVAGPAEAVWAQASQTRAFGMALDQAMYEALSGALDADSMLATVAAAVEAPAERACLMAGIALPGESAWWIDEPAEGQPVVLRAAGVDTRLLGRLLDGGTDR